MVGLVGVAGRRGGGAAGEEEARRAGELGLGVNQERALGGHFVSGAQAGADDQQVLSRFALQARPKGEWDEFEAQPSVGQTFGDAPGHVANPGGQHRGLRDEREGACGSGERRINRVAVGTEGSGEAGLDETAGQQAAGRILEMQMDLTGSELGVQFR